MRVIVVSPHPDDETLGAGGTILRLMAEGHELFWVNVTSMRDLDRYTEAEKLNRQMQLKSIEKFYNYSEKGKVFHLNFPAAKLENVETDIAVERMSSIFKEVHPEMLILPDFNDAHSDHKRVFDWCFACSKVFRFPYIKTILTMEILSETDFGRPEMPFYPNYFVDISNYIEKKIEALKIYDTEMGRHPFPRSEENIKALAVLRGAMAGVPYAEAFRLIKKIV